MATIVILQHGAFRHLMGRYMVHGFAERWRQTGHTVLEHFGTEAPPAGDVAILHVDLTVIPAEYRELLSRFPRVINGAVLDISKRRVSQNLVLKDSDWRGPVVVKTNNNFFGQPELAVRGMMEASGERGHVPSGLGLVDYPIYVSVDYVPQEVWQTADFVVEKFLPEQDAQGNFFMRTWTFFGDRERSSRFRAQVPIIKSRDILGREIVPVPDELRAWRAKFGFDFGKFDYVVHEGRPVLLDTNRSPGMPDNLGLLEGAEADYRAMADALRVFLP